MDETTAPETPVTDATPVATTTSDPYDYLMNAASDQTLWMLIGGPLGLLLLIAVVYALLIARKRRTEATFMRQAVEEEGGAIGAQPESTEPRAHVRLVTESDTAPLDVGAGEVTAARETAREQEREKFQIQAAPDADLEPPPPLRRDVEEVLKVDRPSWLARLRGGLTKTRDALSGTIGGLFGAGAKLDDSLLERLHEALYRADIGVATADKLVQAVKAKIGKDASTTFEAVAPVLKEEAKAILAKAQAPVKKPASGPFVILIVGVNGVGKTTTIGKLGAHFLAADQEVLLAAADTFRAAAIEQLEVWGKRLGVDVVRHKAGADPAAVAYDAVKAAMARETDVLLIDTAGRLHSKAELMAELGKINRVVGKDLPGAPHETWLVIDATTGQNAVAQVKAFKEVVNLTGLVVTKLDGTAKGGVLIGIADQFGLPIHYVGVGEKAADLRAFDVGDYVDSLF